MSLFDHGKDEEQAGLGRPAPNFEGFHPVDDAKKIMAELTGILRDVRKMVDKASRAMKILGE